MNLTVGTSPIAVIDSTRVNAPLIISNATGLAVYLGPPNVTVGTGYVLAPGASLPIKSPVPLYAVASASAAGLNVLSTFGGNFGGGSSQGMFPQSIGGNTSPVQRWAVGNYYAEGTMVSHRSGLFVCKVSGAATDLGDEPGVEGAEGEWSVYWRPISLLPSDFGPKFVSDTGGVTYPSCGYGSIIVPMTTTQWAAFTVSTTGAPSINNTIEDGFRMTVTTTGATAALIRQYSAMTFNRNWLPGKNSEIDWDKPFRIRIPMRLTIGGTGLGFKYTLLFGGLSAAPTGHTMSGKGFNLCVIGTGANAGTVQIGAHDGSGQNDDVAPDTYTFDGSLKHLDVWNLPGVGATLMVDGVACASIDPSDLPTGVTTSAQGWAALMEHTTATNGSSILQQHPFIVDFLAP